jgi:hypothetical protein
VTRPWWPRLPSSVVGTSGTLIAREGLAHLEVGGGAAAVEDARAARPASSSSQKRWNGAMP